MLRTINRVLRNYPGPHNNCILENKRKKPTAEQTTRPPTKTTTRRTTSTTRRITSTTPMVEEYSDEYQDEFETCTNGEFYADPKSCDKYFICNHDRKVEYK